MILILDEQSGYTILECKYKHKKKPSTGEAESFLNCSSLLFHLPGTN